MALIFFLLPILGPIPFIDTDIAKNKVDRNVSEKAQDQKFANYDISEITTELSNVETTTPLGSIVLVTSSLTEEDAA